jgi:hypothetical protein
VSYWPQKPPNGVGIDWSHSISKRLLFAYLFRNDSMIDELGKSAISLNTRGATFTGTSRGRGLGKLAGEVGGYNVSIPSTPAAYTIVISATIRDLATGGYLIRGFAGIGTIGLGSVTFGSGSITVAIGRSGFGAETGSLANCPENCHIVISATAGNYKAWVNGRRILTSGASNDTELASLTLFYNGNPFQEGGVTGAIEHMLYLNGLTTDAEAQALAANPYSFMARPRRLISVPSTVKKIPWHLLTGRAA